MMINRRVLTGAELADRPLVWPVSSRKILGHGVVSDFVNDAVQTPAGSIMHRQYATHPGAVVIIAWNSDDQIALVRQYRHPAGFEFIEPPAGLLDHEDEVFLTAAQRELAEEVGLAASRWQVLADVFSTPGANEESVRIFLATELTEAPRPEGFILSDEEAEMEVCWGARAELVEAIFAGKLQASSLVHGILALEVARVAGRLEALRDANAHWPARDVRRQRNVGSP